MNIEKNLHLTMLFEFYYNLLTTKQQDIFKMYYFEDISLGEIAIINNTSRQAVRDCLVKAQSSLFNFEDKLNLLKKYQQTQNVLNSSSVDEETKKRIMQVWEGK